MVLTVVSKKEKHTFEVKPGCEACMHMLVHAVEVKFSNGMMNINEVV